jgi:LPLT family lysophospholipid transporter-like MFS transporter
MSRPAPLDLALGARPMQALMVAQFVSAFADNALLVVAIAAMKNLGQADQIPLLQAGFLLPYILLAAFVGTFADRLPKGRVMLVGNALKLGAAGLLAAGLHPLAGYALAGVGAAIYSPAKYGILTQFFRTEKLVRANSLIESSTIVAILLGVVAGGYLADAWFDQALFLIGALYLLALLATLLIPRLAPEQTRAAGSPLSQLRHFRQTAGQLQNDADARDSLLATSLFWGLGATLRLMLFAWVPIALLLSDNQTPANLMGALSIGIVFGALLAAAWVKLETVSRALLGGWLLSPLVMALAWTDSLPIAYALMLGLGMGGGLFVVPMNALLQDRGLRSVGTGQALAIQNFWENSAMLLGVGAYQMLIGAGVSVTTSMMVYAGLLIVVMAGLSTCRRRSALKPRQVP